MKSVFQYFNKWFDLPMFIFLEADLSVQNKKMCSAGVWFCLHCAWQRFTHKYNVKIEEV